MNVTQKDIAKTLGLSVSLVSRALSGKWRGIGASERIIQRIVKMAKTLGYFPSVVARSLRGGPTKTIGVVVFDFDDPFFNPVISQIQQEAHQRRLSTVLVGFEHWKIESRDTEALFRYCLDAAIVVGSGTVEGWIELFLSRGTRVIQIGGGKSSRGIIQLAVDNAKDMALIARHLLGMGHQRFGFVGNRTIVFEERCQLLYRELERTGLKRADIYSEMVEAPVSESGYHARLSMIKKHSKCLPIAIVAASDAVAIGAMRAIHKAELNVPGDISLTGFDDIVAAKLSVPPLTTIRHPISETVGKAMELASAKSTARCSSSRVLMDLVLVMRESTAPVSSRIGDQYLVVA